MIMPIPSLAVDRLSKRYRIGLKQNQHDTLGGAALDLVRRPLTNLRGLRKLTDFSGTDKEDDVIWALKDVYLEIQQGEIIGVIPISAPVQRNIRVRPRPFAPGNPRSWR